MVNMTSKYKVDQSLNCTIVRDPKTEYSLEIETSKNIDGLQIWLDAYFNVPLDNSMMFVTGRSLNEYDERVYTIPISADFQYIEVGAGLGEFIPHIVKTLNCQGKRPIVIDLVNYNLLQDLLSFALNLDLKEQSHNNVKTLAERCAIMLDETKVKLVNKKLGDAIQQNPELCGIADFVVDNAGPSLHTSTELAFNVSRNPSPDYYVYSLETKLLKKNGRLISYSPLSRNHH